MCVYVYVCEGCMYDFGDLEASVSGQVAAPIPCPMCPQEQKGLFSEVGGEAGWSRGGGGQEWDLGAVVRVLSGWMSQMYLSRICFLGRVTLPVSASVSWAAR